MCELKSERNFESMPKFNYIFLKLSPVPTAHMNVTRDTQHAGNMCLANTLIKCKYATISLYISQPVTPKLTLIRCNLGGYKTAYIGVFKGQNLYT